MRSVSTLLTTLALLAAAPAARADTGFRWGFGGAGGVGLQSDEYVLGPRIEARPRVVPFLELEAGALTGLGADFFSVRPTLHVRAVLTIRGFRLYPFVGPSVELYWPRGPFADFCDKADIDCAGSAWGLDLGIGAGYRSFGVEASYGTGDLPLFTLVATALFRVGR